MKVCSEKAKYILDRSNVKRLEYSRFYDLLYTRVTTKFKSTISFCSPLLKMHSLTISLKIVRNVFKKCTKACW